MTFFLFVCNDVLYTKGSNRFTCLGRTIDELDVEYTSVPDTAEVSVP